MNVLKTFALSTLMTAALVSAAIAQPVGSEVDIAPLIGELVDLIMVALVLGVGWLAARFGINRVHVQSLLGAAQRAARAEIERRMDGPVTVDVRSEIAAKVLDYMVTTHSDTAGKMAREQLVKIAENVTGEELMDAKLVFGDKFDAAPRSLEDVARAAAAPVDAPYAPGKGGLT